MKRLRISAWALIVLFLPLSDISAYEEAPYLDEKIDVRQIRLERARMFSYKKNYAASIAEYQELLKHPPADKKIVLELASVYAYAGMVSEANDLLRSFKDPLSPDETKAIAFIYTALKEYDRADSYYKVYLGEHPDDLFVRFKYAEMLSWQKKYEDSIREYRRVLLAKPHDEQVRRKFAMTLIWMGETDTGVDELKRTLHER